MMSERISSRVGEHTGLSEFVYLSIQGEEPLQLMIVVVGYDVSLLCLNATDGVRVTGNGLRLI